MAKHTEHDETALLAWAIGSDTGLSSRAMVQRIVIGGRPEPGDYPRDPADLGRCLRLIEAVPTLLIDLHMMRDVSPEWAGMVKAWSELKELYEAEAPSGRAPKCYALMKDIERRAALKETLG